MTSCILTCNNETENNEIMESIWQAIRYWKEYERHEVFLCRWKEDGKFHTGLSIESRVPASLSIKFEALGKPRKSYDMLLKYVGEEKRLQIPADVVAKLYNENDITPSENKDNSED